MAQAVKDSFLDLERHRQLLEENIEKLKKSLRHWQTWEAEYEGLKEEILAVGSDPTREQLVAIGRDYEGELVTPKEVEDILGLKAPRESDQVINILSRRIDYVQQNVGSVMKQLDIQERKLAAATIISNPEVRNEDGLPMTEIFEELDEDGNVITSYTSTPGSSKSQLIEVLQKAGVQDLPEDATFDTDGFEDSRPEKTPASIESIEEESTGKLPTVVAPDPNKAEKLFPNQPSDTLSDPIIPADESPEDAALRKEILAYGISEVGRVVAELNIEEGTNSMDDEEYDFEEYSSLEDDDDEDEFGRSTRKVIDEELKQRMLELEKRLGVRMMENVGPRPDTTVRETAKDQHDQSRSEDLRHKGSVKKAVRFADTLDISPSLTKPIPSSEPISTRDPNLAKSPVNDIVERSPSRQEASYSTSASSKVSRFRSARAGLKDKSSPASENGVNLPDVGQRLSVDHQTPGNTKQIPTGPPGETLAAAIVEREVSVGSASEPDELDSSLLHQEVATEYYRVRNRMVQRQGGFKAQDEEDDLVEIDQDGTSRRVSRFKAARLARQ